MLQLMNDLPENVLGILAEGKVTGKNYEDILMPAVEENLKPIPSSECSIILEIHSTDLILAPCWMIHHLINTFAKFFGYLLPCEVRVFKNEALEEAKKWIVEV